MHQVTVYKRLPANYSTRQTDDSLVINETSSIESNQTSSIESNQTSSIETVNFS